MRVVQHDCQRHATIFRHGSAAPVLFRFAFHRWRGRILDLQPMRRTPGAIQIVSREHTLMIVIGSPTRSGGGTSQTQGKGISLFRLVRQNEHAARLAPCARACGPDDPTQRSVCPISTYQFEKNARSFAWREKLYSHGFFECLVHFICSHEDDYFTGYKATFVRDH
jgi:hypothetical protein